MLHDTDPCDATGDDVIGPADDEDVVELLVVVELEDGEVVLELLLVVLVGNEEAVELDGSAEVVVVVVADVTDGRAARQVQTAWADADADKAPSGPQELITHPIARFAML